MRKFLVTLLVIVFSIVVIPVHLLAIGFIFIINIIQALIKFGKDIVKYFKAVVSETKDSIDKNC